MAPKHLSQSAVPAATRGRRKRAGPSQAMSQKARSSRVRSSVTWREFDAKKSHIDRRRELCVVVEDWEIWASANEVIKQHGEGASQYAAERADSLLEKGDLEGKRVWLSIQEKIRELQRLEPADGEELH